MKDPQLRAMAREGFKSLWGRVQRQRGCSSGGILGKWRCVMGSFGERYFVCDRNHLHPPASRDLTKSISLTAASGVDSLFIMGEVSVG